ncbi:MAG: bifunctional folylpolyglutamate synthase/dihydrofolate synthase, partial [Pseudomonadota bacterium]
MNNSQRAEALDREIATLTADLPRVIDLSLQRMHDLLADLGNPHHSLPPVVHIAGTNGKGSTLAFLQAIAQAAGLRVHRFSSPHLVSYCERVSCDGKPVDPRRFLQLMKQARAANKDHPLSQFELITAAAFLGF